MAEIDDAGGGLDWIRLRLDAPTAAVRFLHDAQLAKLDGVDEGQPEMGYQHPPDRLLVEVGRRQVQPKPPTGQVSTVGEADVEVEVGALVRHVREPTVAPMVLAEPVHSRPAPSAEREHPTADRLQVR